MSNEEFWSEWEGVWPICSDPVCTMPAVVELTHDKKCKRQCWQHGSAALIFWSEGKLWADKLDEVDWITAKGLGLPE